MQAMLLAAGLGTRLRPLTDSRPKPIVPVANRPLASFALQHLARSGVKSVVANTHPQPDVVEAMLADWCPTGLDLRFSREATLLGTGGGLRAARARFDDPEAPAIVINGDTLFAPDLRAAYAAHVAKGAVATMILRTATHGARFGTIGIDESSWVRTLLGAPKRDGVSRELMFTGVHVLSPEAFDAMPESGCVIRSAYRRWVDRGAPVLAIVDDSPWADLGTLADYHRVNVELARGALRWPGVSPRAGCILPSEVEAQDRIRDSVVGEGVRIDEHVVLRRCVVWPGTSVHASATDAVLTPHHRVEISARAPVRTCNVS